MPDSFSKRARERAKAEKAAERNERRIARVALRKDRRENPEGTSAPVTPPPADEGTDSGE